MSYKKMTRHLSMQICRTGVVLMVGLLMLTIAMQEVAVSQDSDSSDAIVVQFLSNEVPAEDNLVSMEISDLPLSMALEILADKAEVGFSYNPTILRDKKVDLNMKDVPVHIILYELLKGTNLEPVLPPSRDVIVIREKEELNNDPYQETVEGRVTDNTDGQPIPGATVVLQGTTTGTTTDADGYYSISVPATGTLVFSFVGFESQEIPIESRNTINVQLISSVVALDEAIVTAFGLRRDQRSLGVSVGQVSGDDISRARDVNVANVLSGRVAGVQVGTTSSGPGGSTRIVIRGNSSLAGENQPLYVIDGVPIDNSNRGSAGRWGGYDRGDGIQNINPNDIEEISVLKGANATALYGQRGANGVILITTKTGENRQGIGVEINSNTIIGSPAVWPDFQNEYGLGNNGRHRFFRDTDGVARPFADWNNAGQPDSWVPQITTINDGVESPISYGPRMDGQEVYSWDGQLVNFTPQPNNMRDFFQTETTIDNSVSLSGGDETSRFRLSLSNMSNQGILPTHELDRKNVTFRGSSQLSDRFRAEISLNYISQQAKNRPGLSDQQRNVAYSFRYMPRNTQHESLRAYEITQEDINNPYALHGYSSGQRVEGYTRHWSNATFTEQPYWVINNVVNEDSRERILGNVSLSYEINEWASISAKIGTDRYTDQRFNADAIGTRVNQDGSMSEQVHRFQENNIEAILSMERSVSEDITLSANVGGNYFKDFFRNVGHSGSQFTVPNIFSIGFTQNRGTSFSLQETEIHSLFAFGQINFRDYWYIDWTARNDWASTLPPENNSFFYPSVSSNFVWSDAFDLTTDVLSFGSFRASWALAGSSGSPYQLVGTYSPSALPQDGRSMLSFQNSVPFQDLKNELTTSYEFGTDLRFFGDRIRLDATYYHATTENQILNITTAPSSGFTGRQINAGEINNQGIELMLSGTPVADPGGLMWDISFNFAMNRNKVISLTEGVDRFQLGIDRIALIFADPGRPYGEIYSAFGRWLRDDDGNRLINPNTGLPLIEQGQFAIGNINPDWTGGIMNTLNYRGFSFSALIDIRQGGQIASMSNVYEAMHGTSRRTLEGRDGTYVAEGVVAAPDGSGGWTSTGTTNTMQINAQDYWQNAASSSENSIAEEFLNDGSFIAMREMSIGYSFPTLVTRLPVNSLRLSISGRNLFYFVRHTDGFAPEASAYNAGNSSLGLESAAFPMTRTIGFNLNLGL